MKGFIHGVMAMAVMGLAFWAYRENYATQAALREVRDLRAWIGQADARVNMLNAEWAYLNRPDRLRDLVDLNFDRLGLLPLMPDAFGKVDQIAYPPAPMLPFTNSVTLSSDGADGVEPL